MRLRENTQRGDLPSPPPYLLFAGFRKSLTGDPVTQQNIHKSLRVVKAKVESEEQEVEWGGEEEANRREVTGMRSHG